MATLHDMGGKGNCLFKCLGYELGVHHMELRRLVSQFVINNLSIVNPWIVSEDGYKDALDYAEQIAKRGHYGGELTITIISIIFKRTINVWTNTKMSNTNKQRGSYFLYMEYVSDGPEINLFYALKHYWRLTFT
jgi:hypothetical protein